METYTDYKPFIHNPNVKADRQVALDSINLELAETNERVEYRLAYIAICIEHSLAGKKIRQKLINIHTNIKHA